MSEWRREIGRRLDAGLEIAATWVRQARQLALREKAGKLESVRRRNHALPDQAAGTSPAKGVVAFLSIQDGGG
jgi:hypothetical protein